MIEFAASVPHLTTVAPGGALVLAGGVVVEAAAVAVAVAVTVAVGLETAVVGGTCALVA